jgi:hypothetical protein
LGFFDQIEQEIQRSFVKKGVDPVSFGLMSGDLHAHGRNYN